MRDQELSPRPSTGGATDATDDVVAEAILDGAQARTGRDRPLAGDAQAPQSLGPRRSPRGSIPSRCARS